MLDYRMFGRGRVTYDCFEIDPSIPMVDQAQNLIEDLLQVVYDDDVILDVGWYPDSSPDGRCYVAVITNSNWGSPRFERSSTDYQEVIEWIRTGARIAAWLEHGDKTVIPTLYVGNNPRVPVPTWGSVLDALLALNGQDSTLICLEAPDGTTLMIGGGNDDRFLVDYLIDPATQQNYVLTDPALTGPVVELCCGGQASEYPANWCVGLDLVLDAAHHFCGKGGMAPQLAWTEDR